MLELRPNCEFCNKDLPPDSLEAYICSYECTFCSTCLETVLKNICPNCGGGFSVRPVRPAQPHRQGVGLVNHPPSKTRVHTKLSASEILAFSESIRRLKPEQR